MRDDLFGGIEYKYSWNGECTWFFLGKAVQTRLTIAADEGEEISIVQREAFVAFLDSKKLLCALADEAIYSYYKALCPEYRDRFGADFADKWAPIISDMSELAKLAKPRELLIQESFADPPERIVGLLFDCTWDPNLGMAVKFVNEDLREVGTQDIVL